MKMKVSKIHNPSNIKGIWRDSILKIYIKDSKENTDKIYKEFRKILSEIENKN